MILLTNMYNIGSSIGCLISPYFIVHGRRLTLLLFCVVIIITSFMSITGVEFLLNVARLIAGIVYGL